MFEVKIVSYVKIVCIYFGQNAVYNVDAYGYISEAD